MASVMPRYALTQKVHSPIITFSMGSSKHDDYILLEDPITSRPRKGHRWPRFAFIACGAAFSLSIIINLHLLLSSSLSPPGNALDNYQPLNHNPIIDPTLLETPNYNSTFHPEEYAVVTTLYTDAFASAVATLGHSLKRANTTSRMIVLYLPDKISEAALCLATSSGFIPHAVNRISPPHDGSGVHRHFVDQFTKLSLWTLDQAGIKGLVYLDADTLVTRNFEELFRMPFTFAAVPDVFLDSAGFTLGFNAGVMFVRPSTAVFRSLTAQLATARYPLQDAEQSYLNHYFGAEAVRLPYAYNGNLAIKLRKPQLWQQTAEERRIIHYTLIKPFLQGDYQEVPFDELEEWVETQAEKKGGVFREEVHLWGDMFREFKTKYRNNIDQCFR